MTNSASSHGWISIYTDFRTHPKFRCLCETKKKERFQFIKLHKGKYTVSTLSKKLEVSRAGYYHWLTKPISNIELRHQYLTEEIKRVFKQHNGNYGSPRIAQQLYDEGIETNKRVVAELMQKAGLKAKGYRKRSCQTTKKPLEKYIYENIINREFNRDIIDEIWVTDITYVPCSDGRLYLNNYIDLTTRIPRCYEIAASMKKEIAIAPLKSYHGKRPEIVHSDRGSQYTF
jgi:putative transposase